MYSLIVSKLAHEDLDSIVSYIVDQLKNTTAAIDFLNEVDKCYGYLRTNPFMYESCYDIHLFKKGYRKVIIKNYVLIYKVNEASKMVNIYRFFHCSQNYASLI